MKKTIVVVGAGKGLGNHVAKKFGKNDFRVVLMARNEKSLKEYEEEFATEGIETYTQAADVENVDSITSAFNSVKEEFGTVDVLVYNVGITSPDNKEMLNSEELMRHYQIDVASAYHCIKQVVSEEFGKKNGTIILTGGGLALYPMAEFTCLSIDKAALRALAFALNKDLKDKGIFVGTVTIMDAIKSGTHFAPNLIAEKYWDMYNERQECEVVYQ
jgi:short-subunit dehydrogenase